MVRRNNHNSLSSQSEDRFPDFRERGKVSSLGAVWESQTLFQFINCRKTAKNIAKNNLIVKLQTIIFF
jgi:hypothetical protein